MLRKILALVFAIAVVVVGVHAQSGAKNGEWRHYGADTGHTRYSPLDQINATNFSKLTIAWRFNTTHLGPRPEYSFESTPLMVNGVLYSTAGTRRSVVAIDPETGEELWVHREDEGKRSSVAPRQLSGRGLAYWSDGKEERILYVTIGYQLVALNAKTGMRIPNFGNNGIIDLKQNNDQVIDPMSAEIGLHATPMIAGNVVLIGAAHKSGGIPTGKSNVKGYIRAFDVRSGKRLWIFHTIPQPGEFGNETWLNDSWSYTGNTGAWAQISIDEELGIAYLPVESATGDYFGADRPGANLFAESLVAVDLQTGKRKWHYQLVHHGIWDHDIPCPPILVDINRNGKIIKAVAQPTKQAFMYVFDRVTGQPLWPIEERPVPKGDVPGEWYSPTQPFPLDARGRPFNYDAQGFVEADLIDFTPELRAEGMKVISRYKIGPVFTPPVVSVKEGPIATLVMAAAGGGTNWPGGSFDPETGILYANSQKSISQLGLVPPRPESKTDLSYIQGNAIVGARLQGAPMGAAPAAAPAPALVPTIPPGPPPVPGPAGEGGGGAGLTVQGLPLMKPPYGQISAIDLTKGEIIWQVAHGETPDAIKNHPALKGLNIPRTGRPGNAGSMVTKTLLVSGEAGFGPTGGPRGAMLRAYDKATGKEVGAVYMPAPQTGSPMTYMVNGRQYIVVAVSGAGFPGELVAYRLP
jgi:quinoprotein glucose dehydrogenase